MYVTFLYNVSCNKDKALNGGNNMTNLLANKVLLSQIMTEDEWDRVYPYEVDSESLKKYMICIGNLLKYQSELGFELDFTSPNENYSLHTINITWPDQVIDMCTKELLFTLFSNMTGFLMDNERREWQFSIEIYKEA